MSRIAKLPRKLRKFRYALAVALVLGCLATALVLRARGGSALWFALPALSLAAAHALLHRPGAVPIFTYHSVSDEPQWLPWAPHISISSALFAGHLDILRRLGCTVIDTAELVRARREGRPLPPRAVALHLDDGYLDNWVAALPLLRRHGMRATIFVSTDFIDRSRGLRPTLQDVQEGRAAASDLQWRGYLNVDELRAMQGSGLIDIQAHGTDHARVFTGPEVVGTLTDANWRNLAWVQWRATPGNKSRWYEADAPAAVPLGSPVLRNGPALTSRAWRDGELETPQQQEARALASLRRARSVLGRLLRKDVTVFCWPQNKSTARARELAHQAGYLATTGGWEENRAGQDASILSRTHVGKDVLGLPSRRADEIYFAAQVRVGLGNYYWYPVVIVFNFIRGIVGVFRPAPLKSQP